MIQIVPKNISKHREATCRICIHLFASLVFDTLASDTLVSGLWTTLKSEVQQISAFANLHTSTDACCSQSAKHKCDMLLIKTAHQDGSSS
jgi:hypothetical protein